MTNYRQLLENIENPNKEGITESSNNYFALSRITGIIQSSTISARKIKSGNFSEEKLSTIEDLASQAEEFIYEIESMLS